MAGRGPAARRYVVMVATGYETYAGTWDEVYVTLHGGHGESEKKLLDKRLVWGQFQLNQVPGEKNPIFLPSDPEFVWLLAKIWVRSSDFQVHEMNSHLLRTHLLGEVFSIATLCQLPDMHPLFKLLIPHTKYTLDINTRARAQLIGKNAVFDRAVASGGGGHLKIAQKAFQQLTYKSLCFPDDLEERGLQGLKKHYYQEDGLKIWVAILRFVENIVGLYYRSDLEVKSDSELQAWVKDIYKEGFCKAPNSGEIKFSRVFFFFFFFFLWPPSPGQGHLTPHITVWLFGLPPAGGPSWIAGGLSRPCP
nr:PREDICTED: arachidonate 5-lipoxygenase-like [Latimeria chalumnae]|eukprot:XP_014339480.1 PREDICTED: arachidonate 5-lipoxygenase-like [Latimeria chalumnae]